MKRFLVTGTPKPCCIVLLVLGVLSCGDADEFRVVDASNWRETETQYMAEDTADWAVILYGPWVDEYLELAGKTSGINPIAMTSDRYILLGDRYWAKDLCHRAGILAHESIHLLQVKRAGGSSQASENYIRAWLTARLDGAAGDDAYRDLEQEREAYAYENEVVDLCNGTSY